MSMTLTETQWFDVGRRIFSAWGADEATAACVARALVDSDLAGISSPGGGHILASVHNLEPDVPGANVWAMVQAARHWGTYPLCLPA